MKSREEMIQMGLLVPKSTDWSVEFVFLDGTSRKVRVSPGTLAEDEAVSRACNHAKVFDRSVVKTITARRVDKSLKIAPFGMIQKG